MRGGVKFIGPLFGKDKEDIYRNSDIFVFPSKCEPFGLVLLEAMAYGLPIVSTKGGSIPYVVKDGENAFLAEVDDINDIADKIELLINNKNLRKKFGSTGRKLFDEKFHWEHFEKTLKNIFLSSISD